MKTTMIKDPTYLLCACKLFSELSSQEMAEIRAITTTRSVKKGELIFREGQESHGFFILVSGVVKIFRIAPNGREQIIHLVEAGDAFAEATIFNGTYPANAEALSECVLLRIEREGFRRVLAHDPQLSFKIMATLEKWLRRMRERISELCVNEVPARFACYVLSLPPGAAHRNGQVSFDMSVSKTMLAQMLGTTKETLSRIIHRLRQKRIVDYSGRRLVVVNRCKLEKVASGEIKLT
jgi:CRP/FNR family transcriptional regulator